MRSLKKIISLSQDDPDLVVLAEDEAGLVSIPTLTRMWSPKGVQPLVPTATTNRKRITLFGAVNVSNGEHFSAFADRGNIENFKNFLEFVLEENPDKRIVMILDNVGFHHSNIINKEFLPKTKNLEFLFLPAYSPDLNPQEWVWKELRAKVTHNTYYNDFTDELKATHDFLKNYRLPVKDLLCHII